MPLAGRVENGGAPQWREIGSMVRPTVMPTVVPLYSLCGS